MNQPKKDYYSIMEIERDASQDDITTAYRRLAKIWHPDRIKDPEKKKIAEEKFKEITEANSVLSDPEKRKKYDQFGLCDGETPDFGAQGFPDLSEIFGQMGGMGGMGGMPGMGGFPFMGGMPGMGNVNRSNKNVSQEVKIKLKLSDIFNGCEKQIEINYENACEECDGTGSKTKKKKTCTDCNGRGIRMVVRQIGPGMISQQTAPCSSCGQKGWISDSSCTGCKGKCTISSKLNKKITIKKNFDYQTKMCLRESGNFDPDSGKKADIYITFKIGDLDDYEYKIVNDYDIVYEHSINIWDALSGHTIYYKNHPNGKKYALKTNQVIKDDDVKVVKNLGLPNDDDGKLTFGKFIIKYNYIYPKESLNSEQLKTFLKQKVNIDGISTSEYVVETLYDPAHFENESRSRNGHGHGHGGHGGGGGGMGGFPDMDGQPAECRMS